MRGIHLLAYLVALQVAGLVVKGCHIPANNYNEDGEDEVQPWNRGDRVTREVTLGERFACGPDVTPDQVPPNRVITGERLALLKQEMIQRSLDGYIIPSSDEHQSEYVAPADERRKFISGFSGSSGMAVVTARHQALWTDGRYFLQADQQLDCDWLLMKMKNPGVPKMTEWVQTTLRPGAKVGADPRLIGAESWISYAEDLAKFNITLVAEETNLVDLVWPSEERPKYPNDPIYVLESRFAGKTWEEKVREVREEMAKKGAEMLVVTALDEVAWLLNLRGNDIPYNPVFRAYVILAPDRVELYVPPGKITPAVDNHLRVNQCGDGRECVTINDYVSILDSLRALRLRSTVKKVLLGAQYSYSGGASYAIYSAVPEKFRVKDTSPILLMKARKNPKEVEGMKKAHVKDAVALCDFLSFLENEIVAGRYWSELSAAQRLGEYREQQEDFVGISFTTISAFGSNGAIIHYAPTKETNKQITNESLYLLDSGGQYKDGTTDVTRTLHYGTPTPMQVEAYTRVLMGAVDLATLMFPEGTGDTDVDILARRHLYAVGLDYRHGTGHGIGMFLNVHEAPIQVRIYGGEEHKFEVGHFFSDEPGFYLDGDFGIRLENILTVTPKETPYHFDKQSLGFEPVTLVPFEPRLINTTLLSARQCRWINAYHARVRDVVGGELIAQGRRRGYDWVVAKTEPIPCISGYAGPSTVLRRKRQSEQEQQQEQPEQQEQQQQNTTVPVTKKKVSLEDRKLCEADDVEPKIRVNTTIQVAQLREEMDLRNFEAYIIPINGEQDGYTMEAEDRLPFLTGFTGSSGVAVVTTTQQAFWTDGRYFLQAEDELDCQWLLMKSGQEGVPKVMEWLKEVVPAGGKVAADPKLVSAETWKTYNKELAASEISLVAEETNLVDLVWPAEVRPAYPEDPIFIHELDFAGKRWEDKVKEVREEMVKKGADLLIVTSPDEVAWLLNVRGNDVKTTPVFRGYVIVDRKGVELFIPQGKITPAVDLHLNVNQCNDQECVSITAYSAILNRLRALELNPEVKKVMLPKKWSYSDGASYAIYSAVPEDKRLVAVSPVLLMKARKNPTEVQGMKASHVRDAVAVISFLAFMETQVEAGNAWDEIEAATKLYELRQEQRDFMGMSFETISAFGPNGAVIHYRPRQDTKLHITADNLYLLDSGGQYKDGTTDVTRTMHYGTPTPMQVEAYTRVLMGAIDLATLVFPEGTGDTDVDILARRPLYEVGLDYRHGTGHGIGHFLSVHEAPTQVRIYGDEEHELEIGHFFSDEPGYYQDNEWGIRLETILTVVPLDTKYTFDKRMLGFEAVTLVPFETKLINLTLLDDYQCHWLNAYHQRVKEHVGPELLAQNRGKAYDWMLTKIQPLPCPNPDRLQQDRPHISPPAKATTTTSTTTTTTSTTSASTTTTTTTRVPAIRTTVDDSHALPATSSTTAVRQHNTMRQAVASTTENVHRGSASVPTASTLATALLLLLLPLAR